MLLEVFNTLLRRVYRINDNVIERGTRRRHRHVVLLINCTQISLPCYTQQNVNLSYHDTLYHKVKYLNAAG